MMIQALKKIYALLSQQMNPKLQGMHLSIPEAEGDYAQGTYFEILAAQHHQDFLSHHTMDSADQSPTDYRNAMWNFLSAALKGHKDAQYRLGLGYLRGELGLDLNYELAELWLSKAAAQGHEQADYVLHHTYEDIVV